MRAVARSVHRFRSALRRRQTCNYSSGFVRRPGSFSGLARELPNSAKFDGFMHPVIFVSRGLSTDAVRATNGDVEKRGPLVEYQRRISAGELVDGDACQVGTLRELQRLYDQLVASADDCQLDRYATSRKSSRSRWLWSRFIPESSSASPVKGLYLYGGVGTGKTMLMDLFFEQLYGDSVPAVVEFGAGRGYLTQMLADCYGIKRVFLVERKSYKLKADRSLRQKESLILQRLRIDIEDLNLNAVDTLRGGPYIAIGKHLCGPATDLTLRCCLGEQSNQSNGGEPVNPNLRGLAIATCCHHLCQWKHYINKKYILDLGITKEEFQVIIWFTSWAVDADHGTDLPDVTDSGFHLESIENKQHDGDNGVEEVVRNMKPVERAALGFMCKQIIDMGRLMWMKEHGLQAQFVKYVPSTVSPENHLLIAKSTILS